MAAPYDDEGLPSYSSAVTQQPGFHEPSAPPPIETTSQLPQIIQPQLQSFQTLGIFYFRYFRNISI